MNIPIKLGSNWPSGFREDSKLTKPFLIPLGLLFFVHKININLLKDHSINIPTEFGAN